MKTFLQKVGVIVICVLILSTIISYGCLWSLRQSNFYKPSFLANSIEQTNFDYIILGASTGLTTLNTKIIDSVLQTTGLNLSVDDTALSSQYLMLQHFLAEGKRTKFCVLAPSVASYDSQRNTVNDNDYRFLMYINRPYVHKYYQQFSGANANILQLTKWMPAIGVSYYNAELFYPSILSLIQPDRHNRFDEKGNYSYTVKNIEDKPLITFTDVPIDFTNKYVSKIKELCELHNIQLICYLTPLKGQKAVVKSVDYDVINHSNLLKNTRYFNDVIHVNSLGRQVASLQFANDLQVFKKQD